MHINSSLIRVPLLASIGCILLFREHLLPHQGQNLEDCSLWNIDWNQHLSKVNIWVHKRITEESLAHVYNRLDWWLFRRFIDNGPSVWLSFSRYVQIKWQSHQTSCRCPDTLLAGLKGSFTMVEAENTRCEDVAWSGCRIVSLTSVRWREGWRRVAAWHTDLFVTARRVNGLIVYGMLHVLGVWLS